MSKHVAQSERLNITPLKYIIVFIMVILISFIHITDTNLKDRKCCYKKYRVYRCRSNIGITNCTTDTVTNICTTLPGCLKWLTEIEYEFFPAAVLKFHLGTNRTFVKL